MQQRIPNYIKYLFVHIFSLTIYALLFRVLFYSYFAQLDSVATSEIQQAFGLGIRFDIKLAVLADFSTTKYTRELVPFISRYSIW